MNTPFDFRKGGSNIVYVKPVDVDDLPEDVQAQLEDGAQLYSVHRDTGEQLALVAGRSLAFTLARQNDLVPVTVH